MAYLYIILQRSPLFDFHHVLNKKMAHNISMEQKTIFSVNFINRDIFSVFLVWNYTCYNKSIFNVN